MEANQVQSLEVTADDFGLALEMTREARAERFDEINKDKYGVEPPESQFASQFPLPTLEEIETECLINGRDLKDAFPLGFEDIAYGSEVSGGLMMLEAKKSCVTHCPEKYLHQDFSQICKVLGNLEVLIRRMDEADFSSNGMKADEIKAIYKEIGTDLPLVLNQQLIPRFNSGKIGLKDYNGSVEEAIFVMEYKVGPVTLRLKQNGTQWLVEKSGDFDFDGAIVKFLAKDKVVHEFLLERDSWTNEEVELAADKIIGDSVAAVLDNTHFELEDASALPEGVDEDDDGIRH